jgi:hypothetical protein
MDLAELADFLVEAKVSTYAAQKGIVDSSRKESHDLAYMRDGWTYVDSYFGEKDFAGEEIVYLEEKPIWSMNYYGKMLRDNVPDGFIETLREALLKVSKEEPFRGCRYHARGRYGYFCTTEGAIGFFHGCETVEYERKEVYRLYFHGGELR